MDRWEHYIAGKKMSTTRKHAKGPTQKYWYEDEPIPMLGSYRYFWGGWNLWMNLRYRLVTFKLVPGGTTNQCLWMSLRYRLVTPTGILRALGTGWCYQPVPKAHPRVTSKGKYLSSHHKWCVGEMVKKVHVTQEVPSSNPSHHRMHIFDKNECHWYRLCYPVLKPRAFGHGFGVPVGKTGTYGPIQPVPKGLFSVVSLTNTVIVMIWNNYVPLNY